MGIGAGDMIERFCHRMGMREPPLTTAQHALKATARVKTLASVIGISIGCIIGMFPLLFMSDRKALYFNDKELALYQVPIFYSFIVRSIMYIILFLFHLHYHYVATITMVYHGASKKVQTTVLRSFAPSPP